MSSRKEGKQQSRHKETLVLVVCLYFLRLIRLSSSLLSNKILTVEAEIISNRLAILQLIRRVANRLKKLSNYKKLSQTRTKKHFKIKHLIISLEKLFLLLSLLNLSFHLIGQRNKSHNQQLNLNSSSLKFLNSQSSQWLNLRAPL